MNYPDSGDLQNGKFTDGNPVAGISASIASADHMNAVYDELLNVITFAGVTPSADTKNQLKTALEFYRNASNLNTGTVPLVRLPVTANSTDTTANKLLKVGDFGVGTPITFTGNVDDIKTPGNYLISSSATGTKAFSTAHSMIVVAGATSRFTQYTSSEGGLENIQKARVFSVSWSEWDTNYTTKNLNSAPEIVSNTNDIGELSTANNARTKLALNAAGDAPIFAARAYLKMSAADGATIIESSNIAGITDNGVGDFKAVFLNNIDNYVAVGSAGPGSSSVRPYTVSPYLYESDGVTFNVTKVDSSTPNGGGADAELITIVVV